MEIKDFLLTARRKDARCARPRRGARRSCGDAEIGG
jgi:hypothetical protein